MTCPPTQFVLTVVLDITGLTLAETKVVPVVPVTTTVFVIIG